MKKIEKTIANKKNIIFLNEETEYILIQPVDENDMKELDLQMEYIVANIDKKVSLFAFEIKDWNLELTPWEMPLIFGKGNFGTGAKDTLDWIQKDLISQIEKEFFANNEKKIKYILGGYSLAGLFALWTGYQENEFVAINAASPSVWYKDWVSYISKNNPVSNTIYLSLGNTEEKSKNQIISKVKENIEIQFKNLKTHENIKNVILEWNEGNHFKDSGLRTAKGFVWCLKNI